MALQLRKEVVTVPGGGENFRILHISDVHIWFSKTLPVALGKIIEETRPDLIALTGDYYDTPIGATIFSRFMEETGRHFPVVFIGGNHDTWWGKRVFRRITDVSSCYAETEFFSMDTAGGRRVNVGSRNHLELFYNHKEEINIMLVHNPEELAPADTGNVTLVLAGHLHGGQIVLYNRNNAHYPGGFVFKHCSDRKEIGNATLIVSRGAGDTFPIRINCPKEVVLVTLV